MNEIQPPEAEELERERTSALKHLEEWLEMPMIVLAVIWLVLLLVEFVWGTTQLLQTISTTIWIVFIIDFLLRFTLAPHKLRYLRQSWLTAISLALPALRVFRITRTLRLLQLARATRGMRLVRVVSSINRGMGALRVTMQRRGVGYVSTLTLGILLAGSAGMYAFESNLPGDVGFENYGEALWWTAMLLTTVGSEYWPQTAEGRVLCILLSLYSLGILGYTAATLSTFFVGQDAADPASELPDAQTMQRLENEIQSLRRELRQVLEQR